MSGPHAERRRMRSNLKYDSRYVSREEVPSMKQSKTRTAYPQPADFVEAELSNTRKLNPKIRPPPALSTPSSSAERQAYNITVGPSQLQSPRTPVTTMHSPRTDGYDYQANQVSSVAESNHFDLSSTRAFLENPSIQSPQSRPQFKNQREQDIPKSPLTTISERPTDTRRKRSPSKQSKRQHPSTLNSEAMRVADNANYSYSPTAQRDSEPTSENAYLGTIESPALDSGRKFKPGRRSQSRSRLDTLSHKEGKETILHSENHHEDEDTGRLPSIYRRKESPAFQNLREDRTPTSHYPSPVVEKHSQVVSPRLAHNLHTTIPSSPGYFVDKESSHGDERSPECHSLASHDATPPTSGTTAYTTASEFSQEVFNASRQRKRSEDERSQPRPMTKTPTQGLYSPSCKEDSPRIPKHLKWDVENAPRKHGVNQQQRSLSVEKENPGTNQDLEQYRSKLETQTSRRFVAENQAHPQNPFPKKDVDPRIEYEAHKASHLHVLRNDDSMTYVAVTPSTHSDLGSGDEHSDSSDYTDQEFNQATRPIPRNSGEIRAQKRRNDLLTGLGFVMSTSTEVPNGNAGRDEEGSGISSFPPDGLSQSEYYNKPKRPSRKFEEELDSRSPVMRETSSPSHSFPEIKSQEEEFGRHTELPLNSPYHGSCKYKNIELQSRAQSGNIPIDENIVAEDNMNTVFEKSQNNRRNTWVYDETDLKPLSPTISFDYEEVKHPSPILEADEDRESKQVAISDEEDFDGLSKEARRIFDNLYTHGSTRSTSTRDQSANANGKESSTNESSSQPNENSNHADHISSEMASDNSLPKTWRQTIPPSAYHSLLEKHGDMEMKRQDLIFEFCESESAFLKSMKMVLRLFAQPLKSRGKWLHGLPITMSGLFEDLEEIVLFHSQLYSVAHSARVSQFPLVLKFAEYIRPLVLQLQVYQSYLVRLESTNEELERLLHDSHNKFGQFIRAQNQNPECQSLGLSSYLLKPMQRLTKYSLFFKQLWQLTPRNHLDHLSIYALYGSTDMVIKVLQEVKTREEEYSYVQGLTNKVSGLDGFQLAQRSRRLLAQGLLQLVELTEEEQELLRECPRDLVNPSGLSQIVQTPLSPLSSPASSWSRLGSNMAPLSPRYQRDHTSSEVSSSPVLLRQTTTYSGSRYSSAFSDTSSSSEWSSSYSNTNSMPTSLDFDELARPPASPSSVTSPTTTSKTYRETKSPLIRMSRRGGARIGRAASVYGFLFTDLLLLTAQVGKNGIFRGKDSQKVQENLMLVESVGLCRVLGIIDHSGKAGYDNLLEIDVLPICRNTNKDGPNAQGTTLIPLFLTLPMAGTTKYNLVPMESLVEAKEKWFSAFEKCYNFTLKSLTFPFAVEHHFNTETADSSVVTMLVSGLPLPSAPVNGMVEATRDSTELTNEHREAHDFWRRRFSEVLSEIERVQDAPVMLIGDVALTIGRGLKRIGTIDRKKRNGPQQLLLPNSPVITSPVPASRSSQSRKGILNLGRHNG